MRPIRAIIYGVGSMGALITPMLLQKGVEIVGALARSATKVGRDLGQVAGLDRDIGVIVEDDPAALLARQSPDIAIVSVGSLVAAMYEHFRICLEHRVNVLTIEEESLYPWLTSPSQSAELDEIAKRNGVTLVGSGIQDVYWVKQVSAVAGSMLTVESVEGRAQWNMDDFGPEVAREFYIGRKPEELDLAASNGGWYSPTVVNTLHALVADLGLTVEATQVSVRPIAAVGDVRSEALGAVVPAGRVIGLVEAGRVRTGEGSTVDFEMTGRVYDPVTDVDMNEWLVHGAPADVRLANVGYSTRALTGSIITNRVPDVLNAPPGLVTIDRLPPAQHRPLPLAHYVRW
ncbi:MAG: dihydrodipicolinate reductase [Actinomycetota bacterium]|nr:dihydrodipicolinate reductase [Actinomycetota bacterium]